MEETSMPSGFTVKAIDDLLLVYLLELNNDVPTVAACITLKSDLNIVCSLHDKVFLAQSTMTW